MKKFKYYKTLLTLATVGTLALVSGCGKEEKKEDISVWCKHLNIDVDGDGTLESFKECDRYTIDLRQYKEFLNFYIKTNDEIIFRVISNDTYYYSEFNHEHIEQMEENENTKVFKKLNK